MIDAKCIEDKTDSNIKCPDGKRSATFENGGHECYRKIRIDGCAVIEGPRADWVIEKGDAAVIIELKGRDVEYAANQINATATLWLKEKRCSRMAGLIVARQYPRASASMQLKQQTFARKFKGPLHVVCHNPVVIFENVLSFRGPFRPR